MVGRGRHVSTTTWATACVILLAWLATTASASTLDKRLDAYDCSNPTAIEDRALTEQYTPCEKTSSVVQSTGNHSFQLLVHEPLQRLTGHRCHVADTRNVQYCGKYDHQTLYNRYAYHDLARPPTPSACREMIQRKRFKMPNGVYASVEVGTSSKHFWEEIGTTTEGSTFLWPDKQIRCTGGDWRVDGNHLKNMVVDHHYTITVTQEEYTWDGTTLVAISDKTRIPCSLFDQDCQTSEATYLWSNPMGHCPLALSKRVTGLIAEDKSGQRVFMSTDNSLVRLVMKYQESHCERMVWSTNYDNVYLASTSAKPFRREVDPMGVSLHMYVNNRDDYLYNHLIDQINDELGNVLQADCERRREAQRKDYYLAHQSPGIETYAFGNGTFATAAGEVLYYHQCRKEVVTAAELPWCYDALPVLLDAASPLRETFNASQWFLEPLTHRLTRYATMVPCTKNFAPKYMLANRRWISADPVLHMANPPRPMSRPEFVVTHLQADVDPSKGGLYDEDDMKAWEAFTMIGRIRDAVVGRISIGATNEYTLGPMDAKFQTPSSWFKEKLQGIYGFLQGYGNFSAVIISLVCIWRLLSTVLGWLYGGCEIYRDLGKCAPHILWALCPTWFLLRDRRQAATGRKKTEDNPNEEMRPIIKYRSPTSGQATPGSVRIHQRKRQSAHVESQPLYRHEEGPEVYPEGAFDTAREIHEAINNPHLWAIEDDDDRSAFSRNSLRRGSTMSLASYSTMGARPKRTAPQTGSSSVYPALENPQAVAGRLTATAGELDRLVEQQRRQQQPLPPQPVHAPPPPPQPAAAAAASAAAAAAGSLPRPKQGT